MEPIKQNLTNGAGVFAPPRKRGRPRKEAGQVVAAPSVLDAPSTDKEAAVRTEPATPSRSMRRKAAWLIRRWLAARSAEKRQRKAEAKARALAKTGPEKMAEEILDKVARTEAKSHLGLLVVSSAIFLLGYKGLTTSIGEGGLSFFAKGEAAVVAFAIAVIAQLGWAYLFKIVPVLKGRFLAAALFAVTLFLSAIIAIDARFNMLAMAGDSAVQMDFVGTNAAYEERVRSVFAQASAARQLLPAIRTQASRFREAEIAERSGAYTGSPRPGAVSASYGAVGRQFGDLAKDIETGLSEIDQLEAEAASLLSKMKGEVFGAGPVRARSKDISALADRLDAITGKIVQRDFRVSITAVLGAVEKSIPVPAGGSTGLSKVQQTQLAFAGETVRPAAQTLRDGLKALGASPTLAGVRRPQSPEQAIFTHWRALIGQWIASVFLDVSPAFLLGILIAARRQADRALRVLEKEKLS